MKTRATALILATVVLLAGCASSKDQLLASSKSEVALRSIQSRTFDTTDRERALRTVVATLQDLGFIIEQASLPLGSVTGSKRGQSSGFYTLRMTVSVQPRGESQLLVRGNAQYNTEEVADPELYQRFFAAFSKAMFLDAQQVD